MKLGWLGRLHSVNCSVVVDKSHRPSKRMLKVSCQSGGMRYFLCASAWWPCACWFLLYLALAQMLPSGVHLITKTMLLACFVHHLLLLNELDVG